MPGRCGQGCSPCAAWVTRYSEGIGARFGVLIGRQAVADRLLLQQHCNDWFFIYSLIEYINIY